MLAHYTNSLQSAAIKPITPKTIYHTHTHQATRAQVYWHTHIHWKPQSIVRIAKRKIVYCRIAACVPNLREHSCGRNCISLPLKLVSKTIFTTCWFFLVLFGFNYIVFIYVVVCFWDLVIKYFKRFVIFVYIQLPATVSIDNGSDDDHRNGHYHPAA